MTVGLVVCTHTTVTSLERFGFTPTETKVYEVLLKIGSATGYAVAKAAGLARANAYQALDGLVRRGAARRSATIPARYAALSPQQVVETLERGFGKDLEALHVSLRSLPQAAHAAEALVVHDTWRTFDASLVRGLGQAREELLAVTGPWAPAMLDSVAAARARGVVVRALALGGPAPEGMSLRAVPPQELLAYWSGFPVAAVVDRAAAWCGVLRPGGEGSGIETTHAAAVPFLRHLLRRELATA